MRFFKRRWQIIVCIASTVFVLFFAAFTYLLIPSLVLKKYKNCHNIVEVFNGMGNQFFSYSFGYILEKETGQKVCYDLSSFGTDDNKRSFDNKRKEHEILMLDKFNVDLSNSIYFDKSMYHKQPRFLRTFRRIPWILDNCFRFHVIEDNMFSRDRKIFEGNYFSKKYFYKYRKDLLKFFSLKVPLNEKNRKMLKEIKKHKNSVSIHVRRGDYLNYKTLGNIVTIDNYYSKAVKIFDKMEDVHFFIFSNDLEWVKKNLKTNKPTTYVDINGDTEGYFDFELMRNCKHNIVANSTFSYWAAYLNENKGSIVVAPSRLHGSDYQNGACIQKTLNNWIVINNNDCDFG